MINYQEKWELCCENIGNFNINVRITDNMTQL